MYPVSNDYLTAMMRRATRRRLKGTIGSVAFTGDDIIEGTFEVSNRCAEESDMKIGGVYLGQLEMTFKPSFLSKVARSEYQGQDVTASIGLKVGEEWVDIPLGIYTLQAPKISKNGISVEGYDYMKKLDKKYPATTTSGKMFDILSLIARECSIQLAQTQSEIEDLPNGDELLSMWAENDIETYRDLLYWIAQTCGRFATFNRQGKLELRKFGVSNSVVLDEMHRDTDVVFSGYTTKWTGISVVDMETQFTNYYALEPDDGLTMNLGSNPFLQYGLPEVKEAMRIAVLNEIADIQYTPYSVVSARDPIFDLGDEITFSGGISGDSTGCVMSFTYNLTGFAFEGYGDDPALVDGRSKTDKNISGLLSQVDSNSITYHYFENADTIVLPEDTEVTIAQLVFAVKKETQLNIWHEFKLLTESSAEEERTIVYNDVEPEPTEEVPVPETETVEVGYFDEVKRSDNPIRAIVRYYYDEVLQVYQPIESWSEEGYHTPHFAYFLNSVSDDIKHRWRVTIEMTGGTATIGVTDAHILLSGQGMVGHEKWDGLLDISDETGLYDVKTITTAVFEDDTPTIVLQTPLLSDTEFEDEADSGDILAIAPCEFDDSSLSVILRNIVYNLITEDGQYNIVTADGTSNITTED